MRRIFLFVSVILLLTEPATAQSQDEEPGGLLVGVLEDVLSNEYRSIRVRGVSGALSSRAEVARIELSDADGVWLTLTNAVLDWNRLALVQGQFSVNTLSVEEIAVLRRPGPAPDSGLPTPEAQPFQLPELPVAVLIDQIKATRITLAPGVLGPEAALGLDGKIALADGALQTTLDITRLDRVADRIALSVSYANTSRQIGLDLSLREGANGLVSRLLDLPELPSVALTLQGTGPVEDFTADLTLATDATERLRGQLDLTADGANMVVTAWAAGNLMPLLRPEIAPFFGADTRLDLRGTRFADGRAEAQMIELTAQSLQLRGSGSVNAQGAPVALTLAGQIADPTGDAPIPLPAGGGDTTAQSVDLTASFDAAESEDWTLTAAVRDLRSPAAQVGDLALQANGTYVPSATTPLQGVMDARLSDLTLLDPALARAVGQTLRLTGGFAVDAGGSVALQDVRAAGEDYRATFDAGIDGLRSGFEVQGAFDLTAEDLSRFSGVAGRPLAGRLQAELQGSGAPLSGAFDLRLTGTADELRLGIDSVDRLLAGATTLRINAARGPEGVELRQLDLGNPALNAKLSGAVRSVGTDLTVDAQLTDLGLILSEFPGPATLQATLRDRQGTWQADITADAPGGMDVRGTAAFATNSAGDIRVDLMVSEPGDGPISSLIGLPGTPALNLAIQGSGTQADFGADIVLDTDRQERARGRVTLRRDEADVMRLGADLRGAMAALFPANLRPLLEPTLSLRLDALRQPDGALTVQALDAQSGTLTATGTLATSPEGQPVAADLRLRLTAPEDGAPLALPVPDLPLSLRDAEITATLVDGAEATWTATLTAQDLAHPLGAVQTLAAQLEGSAERLTLARPAGTVQARIDGLVPTDVSLAQTVGPALSLSGAFEAPTPRELRLRDVTLTGADYAITALGTVTDLRDVMATVTAKLDNLDRLSTLAGRPLAGRATMTVDGSADLQNRAFDARVNGTATDIRIGQPQADTLLAGPLRLQATASGTTDAVTLSQIELTSDLLRVDGSGVLGNGKSRIEATAKLTELGQLIRQFRGPATLTASAAQSAEGWDAEARFDGPNGSFATVDGQRTPAGAIRATFDGVLQRLERFVPGFPGVLRVNGTARGQGTSWTLATKATGPAGISADVQGDYDTASGRADITALGAAQLSVLNQFVSPVSVQGRATYQLALNGPPSLNALSGRVQINDTNVALPQIQNALRGLGGQITLSSGQAAIDLQGAIRSGGRFALDGTAQVAAPNTADLAIDLSGLTLTDNVFYSSTLDGQLGFTGPLSGAGRISGVLQVGESEIDISSAGGGSVAPIPNITHVGEAQNVFLTRKRAGLIAQGRASSGSGPAIGLDLTINAPNRIFVRGRGLNAELGGALRIRGTTRNPVPSGSIGLIRGGLEIFGRRLSLSRGLISLQGSLRPYLEFAATSNTQNGTASLEIAGQLNDLDVTVTSEPPKPDEQALALLLFDDQFDDLSPLRVAQLAASLNRLRGGRDTLGDAARKAGIDSFSVAEDETGNPSVGVGGYVSENVYTDVTVNSRGDTEVNINLEVTDSLTLKGTVDNTGGGGIGLVFEKDY